MKLIQKQSQSLKQVMTPQLIQTFKIFQLPTHLLLEKLSHSIEENVFLESSFSPHSIPSSGTESSYMEFKAPSLSLDAHLLQQLALLELPQTEQLLAEALISELDSKGYLPHYSILSKKLCTQFSVDSKDVDATLTLIQSFEPEGVGARNLPECLLLQLSSGDYEDTAFLSLVKTLIQDHLEDLALRNFDALCEELDVSYDDLDTAITFIKDNLNPYPAERFSSPEFNTHITPSFEVKVENGTPKLYFLESETLPDITLHKDSDQFLLDPNLDVESRRFLKEQYHSAVSLIESLHKRRTILKRLGECLFDSQSLFFKKGPEYLIPLLQQDIAKQLDVHPSTVSRLLSSKYIHTPFGLFCLKDLCLRRYFGHTKPALSEIILELARAYPDESAAKLSKRLVAEGISMSRRTLSRYLSQFRS